MPGLNTHGLFRLLSPPSMSSTWSLWSKFANLMNLNTRSSPHRVKTYRPATTQPALPPPHTIMSTSSGMVIFIVVSYKLWDLRTFSKVSELSFGIWEMHPFQYLSLTSTRHFHNDMHLPRLSPTTKEGGLILSDALAPLERARLLFPLVR